MSDDGEVREEYKPPSNWDIFAKLGAKFTDAKTRSQGGKTMAYISARQVMNRLDDVIGPENWWDDYQPIDNAVICRLTVRLPDGQILTKCDVGGFSKMADSSDVEKTGYSDAFKRAAVKFGIGRHLYGDGVPEFVRSILGAAPQPPRDRAYDDGPGYAEPPPRRHREEGNGHGGGFGNSAPRSGKALFAWAKEQEQKTGAGVVKVVNDYGQKHGWGGRMVQWDDQQVAEAYAEASSFLAHANGVGGHD